MESGTDARTPTSTAPDVETVAKTGGQRLAPLTGRLVSSPEPLIFGALIAMVAVFGILEPSAFLSIGNLRNIATDASVLLVLSIGMTYVIATSGIDLSVGSVLVFASIISVKVMSAMGSKGWGTILVGLVVALLAGAVWGLINGWLVAKAKLPPLIVTLASLGMALGAGRLIANGVDLIGVPPQLIDAVGVGRILGLPVLAIIAGVVAVLAGIVLHRTRFGLYTFAIGSSEQSARRAGITVDRHLIKVYLVASTCAGLAGFLSLARFSTTTLNGHSIDALNAIAAVVLGGTSLFGGSGSVHGTVIGVFIPVVLASGFVILGLPPFWQEIAIGAVLVLAVLLDRFRRSSRGTG
jgi:ribose transport system permease protein